MISSVIPLVTTDVCLSVCVRVCVCVVVRGAALSEWERHTEEQMRCVGGLCSGIELKGSRGVINPIMASNDSIQLTWGLTEYVVVDT